MKVVFLHGIGDGDPNRGWLAGLNRGLAEAGYDPVPPDRVIAPQYHSFLSTAKVGADMPPVNAESPGNTAAHREFYRRQARIRRSIADRDDIRTFGTFGYHRVPDPILHAAQAAVLAVGMPAFDLNQVSRYIDDERLRGAVLRCILGQLPTDATDIVLIAHSLGSVIAIDLLDHLPFPITVRRFITIGSPAASPVLHRHGDRVSRKFPYSRVDDWTNVLDPGDVVTGGRGLATVFRPAQDVVIGIGGAHDSSRYLEHTAVAQLIGEVLSPSKDLVPVSVHLSVRMSDDDANNLLTLHFAHAVAANIKDQNLAARYRGALRQAQDELIFTTRQFVRDTGRAVPPQVGELLDGRLPALPERWEMREAVARLAVLSRSNLIEPYDIDTGTAARDALPHMTAALGYPSEVGKTIAQALDEVRNRGEKKSGVPWGRIIPIAIGAALIAAVPLGLAAVGTAGLAGAAATTSSLAAFGPGGMVGGIATIGSLASTGTAAATFGLVGGSGGAPTRVGADALLVEVAIEYACLLLDLEVDTTLWFRLAEAEMQVAADIRQHEEFSDPKSAKMTELRAVHALISSLLLFLSEKGMTPAELSPGVEPVLMIEA
ncbi:lipase family protein [Rhodococcus chondri]|uniref:Alpha/beta hydrolase n=1 Tax=Rhodococcus chondri TaxID=3065941 RepID=A0ABU7JTA4_9NOCA|nr:hypothetical protein [Rhodococcus sp. CC-R104]MEE2032992.1 hypothetical protein [Rhodococcus sp. CC-R104]